MVIKTENFAVYPTVESDGYDFAIHDSGNNFALISFEDLDDLIVALVTLGLSRKGKFSTDVDFQEIV